MKGDPRAGRRKGAVNRATREVQTLARALVQSPRYVRKLRARLIAGTAAPAVEVLVWYYAYGRPRFEVELGADKSLARLIAEAAGAVPVTDTMPSLTQLLRGEAPVQ